MLRAIGEQNHGTGGYRQNGEGKTELEEWEARLYASWTAD